MPAGTGRAALMRLRIGGCGMSSFDSFAFCPTLDNILAQGHAVGQSGQIVALGALSTKRNLAVLREFHLTTGATRTLEVGLFCGGSCLVFTQTHHDLGHPPSGQHVAIDRWQNGRIDGAGLAAVRQAGLTPYLDFREELSSDALPRLIREERRFEIIYVDGSHMFGDAFVDVYYCGRLLETGGVMFLDDCATPDLQKTVRYMQRNLGHCLREIDLLPFQRGRNALLYKAARATGRLQLRAFEKIAPQEWPEDYRFRNF